MKKKSVVILIPFLLVMVSKAGIYRHDKKESEYAALAAKPQFNCVGQLMHNDKFYGSCVLVGHKYVLSAAHCFIEFKTKVDTIVEGKTTIYVNDPYDQHVGQAPDYSVMFNGIIYRCKKLTIYPGYMDTATHNGLDMALLELDDDVKDVVPAVMGTTFNELHADVTGVGYGANGPADKPDQIITGPKKLAGENVIDSIGGYKLNNHPTSMYCDFDHPTNKECNKMGSAIPRPLEYVCSGGDSGGGLFMQSKTGWFLVGICHGGGVNVTQLMKTGYYGQVMEWMRVSVFADWIKANEE